MSEESAQQADGATQTAETPAAPEPSPTELLTEAAKGILQDTKAEEPPPAEEAPAPPAESSEEPKNVSAEWEKLTRKDAEITRMKRELAAEKEALAQVSEIQKLAKENPKEALERLGIDPWKAVLDQDDKPAEEPADENKSEDPAISKEIEALKQQLDELRKKDEAKSAESARQTGIKASQTFLEGNQEKYELTATHPLGAQYLLDTMAAKYKQDKDYYDTKGTLPTHEEIAEEVEAYLEREAQQALEWLTQRNKLKDKWGQYAKPAPAAPSAPTKTTTLSNNMTAERPSAEEPQTEAERVEMAIKQLNSLSQQ